MNADCRLCSADHKSGKNFLEESENFYIVTDEHPLIEGHILIVPKEHVSCIGEYPKQLLSEFGHVYDKVRRFVKDEYSAVSSFEHGKLGQSIFHSHIHILPFDGKPKQIINEGLEKIKQIRDIAELQEVFKAEGQYLFFSIEDELWVVDTDLGFPRFFRDKFSKALGCPERSDWKEMHENQVLMARANKENEAVLGRWKNYFIN